MARESQYIEGYLAENDSRGLGKGLTVGSYLAYQLKGKAKKYSGRYAAALINALERRGSAVIKGRSAMGGVAYYSREKV